MCGYVMQASSKQQVIVRVFSHQKMPELMKNF